MQVEPFEFVSAIEINLVHYESLIYIMIRYSDYLLNKRYELLLDFTERAKDCHSLTTRTILAALCRAALATFLDLLLLLRLQAAEAATTSAQIQRSATKHSSQL